MDTRSLSLFLHLSETLHFGRTSQACHISPSALTRTIKQMEEHLGVPLFERDNRSVHLTQAGQQLQTYARESLQQWETFRDSLHQDSGDLHGEISMYCSVTASYSFLYDILSEFRRRHPKIEIKLHTGDPALAINRVLSGQEDITIAARPQRLPKQLAFSRITVSPLVFIAASAERLETELQSDIKQRNWNRIPMILSEEGLIRDRLNQWFQQRKIRPKVYAQVAGHEAIVSMVSLGFGVGVVPKIVLDNSPLADNIQTLDVSPKLEDYDVGLCTPRKRLKSPLVNAFWSQIAHSEQGD
ncbi:HTH-type transcriptional activator IlvY [Pseudomaricurvus alkylphenolicus]|jgi:LysR family positive regulator for ilvC|uniref:HTH-type transcriptional activator IlvY n=1 Tax=Pseudomaricurvus alkylphenolicus TaxID=1306991 RepID=UPI00141DE817|nr:HTH-type transcriptional activator IlvY [Pseudomaricurvus alkylphenolicus]NIB44460.1 HTH-type transcriptional activator IlvY [Pseudomaricurvus alkylphenolicus]